MTVLIVASGFIAGTALRGWRDVPVLVLLAALLAFPVKWIGTALGLTGFARDIIIFDPQAFNVGIAPTPAVAVAILLAALVMNARRASRPTWELFSALSLFLLHPLGAVILFATILQSTGSLLTLVLTLILPGIGQAYWIWVKWWATGVVPQPLTLLCLAWLALLAIRIVARRRIANWPAQPDGATPAGEHIGCRG